MRPSQIAEFAKYPAVQSFVANHLDVQFRDVRAMLRLPQPEIEPEPIAISLLTPQHHTIQMWKD